jgi:hypothetical protein
MRSFRSRIPVRNPQSAIGNPQFPIGNRQSAIGNAPSLASDALFWALAAATLALHLRLAWSHGPPYASPWITLDEGYRLYPSLRLMRGEALFRDVFAAYPPFSYYLHWAAYELLGVRVSSVRLVLVLAQLATTLTTYALARHLMNRGFALFAALLTVAFGIVRLNMGYSAWYVLPALAATILILFRWAETDCRARRELFLAGACVGIAAGLKLRDGAWLGMGAGAAVVALRTLRDFEPGRARPRFFPPLYGAHLLLPLLALALLRDTPAPGRLVLFALPNALVAAALLARQVGYTAAVRARPAQLLFDLGALGAGVAAVSLPWLLYYGWRLGPALLWRHLVEVPLAMTARMIVWEVTVEPWPAAALLAGGGLALAALAAFAPQRWRAVRSAALLAAAGGPPLVLFAAPDLAIAGGYVLLPYATALALLVAARRRFAAEPVVDRVLVLGIFNATTAMTLHPWTDRNHLLWAWLPAFVLAAFGAARLFDALAAHGRMLRWCVVASVCALLAVWLGPLASAATGGAGVTRLDGSAAFDVAVDAAAARQLQPVIDFINANVAEEAAILEIPSSFYAFVSGRRQAAQLDYFFVIDGELWDEERDLAAIRSRDPTYAFLQSWPTAFPKIDAYLRSTYAPVTRIGNVTVLKKRG